MCSGGSPDNVTVTVNAPPPPASVTSLLLTPNNILVGQSASLAWTTSNATACTASGGSGADGWSGAMPTSSTGLTVGPVSPSGTYQYTLTCTGPGGIGSPTSTTLAVGAVTPPASVNSFTANPSAVLPTGSTNLSWTTTNATSCTASGGTGTDGWNGPQPASSGGTVVGPIVSVTPVLYTLVCNGPGGSSGPISTTVSINILQPSPAIANFVLNPTTIQVGQSSSLSWSTTNADHCVASGGSGTDGWTGTKPTASVGTAVGPLGVAGPYIYTLTCTGPGPGSAIANASLTVNPAPPGAPTVAMTANNQSAHTMQPSAPLVMRWNTTNATACTASGGTGSDGWSGSMPVTSTGLSLSTITTPGIYTYTLNCVGPGGSAAASSVVTVISSIAADCGIDEPSTALRSPYATVNSAVSGVCLLGCGIASPINVVDSLPTNFATLSIGVGVAATTSVWVEDTTTSYPAGRRVGFLVARPSSLLSLGLLNNVKIRTYLDGVQQDVASASSLLELDALGLFTDPNEAFVGFVATKPFDTARLDLSALAGVADTLKVYGSCVTLQ